MFGSNKTKTYNVSPDLVRATYRLLLEQKAMIVVLLIGGLTSAAVAAAILIPAWTIGHITPDASRGGLFGLLIFAAAVWATSFISALTTGIVVAAAQIRCDGGEPDLGRALALAWSRRGPLAAWATLSTLIALISSFLERFGAAGAIVRFLAGLTWAVATVFALPILIAEGTGPIQTARRSAEIVTDRFGTLVRSNIRLAVPWIFATIASVLVAGFGVFSFVEGINDGSPVTIAIGAVFMSIGGSAFFFCDAMQSALTAYLDTLLYRYSIGQPVPGIDPFDMPSVITR